MITTVGEYFSRRPLAKVTTVGELAKQDEGMSAEVQHDRMVRTLEALIGDCRSIRRQRGDVATFADLPPESRQLVDAFNVGAEPAMALSRVENRLEEKSLEVKRGKGLSLYRERSALAKSNSLAPEIRKMREHALAIERGQVSVSPDVGRALARRLMAAEIAEAEA